MDWQIALKHSHQHGSAACQYYRSYTQLPHSKRRRVDCARQAHTLQTRVSQEFARVGAPEDFAVSLHMSGFFAGGRRIPRAAGVHIRRQSGGLGGRWVELAAFTCRWSSRGCYTTAGALNQLVSLSRSGKVIALASSSSSRPLYCRDSLRPLLLQLSDLAVVHL